MRVSNQRNDRVNMIWRRTTRGGSVRVVSLSITNTYVNTPFSKYPKDNSKTELNKGISLKTIFICSS